MARMRVIVLDQPQGEPDHYRYALWADVPVARQSFYANPNAKSAWAGALAADNTALQNGSVVEDVRDQRVIPGTTLAQVETYLQNRWSDYQTYITNYNPWLHYGSTWDGTTWVVQTGA